MNSQELETAKRIGANITVVVWRDDGYGLIDWKQRNEFGRPFGVEFGNPDFVAYAESFGIAGFRPSSAADLAADAAAGARRRRAVARRGPDRLPREPPPDRAPRRARRRLASRRSARGLGARAIVHGAVGRCDAGGPGRVHDRRPPAAGPGDDRDHRRGPRRDLRLQPDVHPRRADPVRPQPRDAAAPGADRVVLFLARPAAGRRCSGSATGRPATACALGEWRLGLPWPSSAAP